MGHPLFSVIISVYNKERFIEETLKSVFAQTYKNFEVIIVNDGSTDKSLEIIQQYSGTDVIIIDQQNNGASNARNTGINQASSIYIALLDGDDLWDKNYLLEMAEAIKKYPDEHVFSCAIAHKNADRTTPARYDKNLDKIGTVDYFESSTHHSILTSSSIVFKKVILNDTGYFNDQIVSGQDTDMWIRIGLHKKIVFINKVLVYYVQDRLGLSNTSFDLNLKPRYEEYKELENDNKNLARFLNRNRFSLAIMSKIHSDKKAFGFYTSEIDKKHLNFKERILLKLPKEILNLFLWIRKKQGRKLYYKYLD